MLECVKMGNKGKMLECVKMGNKGSVLGSLRTARTKRREKDGLEWSTNGVFELREEDGCNKNKALKLLVISTRWTS